MMAIVRRLCLYCGSSRGLDPIHAAAATRLGTLLAEAGIELVYGGGRVGLMGLAADAALAARGRVIGVIPEHLRARELGHAGLSEMIVVASMHARKQRMFELADGFVVLPGGIGTFDETVEVLTWKQLGLHDKPIVLVDLGGYWRPLLALFDHAIAAGFAMDATRALFRVAASVEDLLPLLATLPEPAAPAQSARV
jgi:uncharacterized protein (TIGR00730 family)